MMDLPPEITAIAGQDLRAEQPFPSETATILAGERGRFVLKTAPGGRMAAELVAEQRILRRLEAYRPFVPAPLALAVTPERTYSLLSYLEGENLVQVLPALDEAGRHALIAGYAWTLRRIHDWQVSLPQAANWLAVALDRAERHVERGDFAGGIEHHSRWHGRDAREALAWLRRERTTLRNDLVMSHGDYCLPNVLTHEGRITGVIDWSRGGYADRRFDLATALWSIGYNLKEERYTHTFLAAYGYRGDPAHLAFFEALYVLL